MPRFTTGDAAPHRPFWSRSYRRIPSPASPRYDPGMSTDPLPIIAIAGAGVITGAFSIWLAVRIINRRERWAIATAVAMVVAMVAVAARHHHCGKTARILAGAAAL